MPIRRELRPLYPPQWRELSQKVRFERAGGRCQRCGRPHGAVLRVLPDGRWFDPSRKTWRDGRGREAHWPDLIAAIRLRETRVVRRGSSQPQSRQQPAAQPPEPLSALSPDP